MTPRRQPADAAMITAYGSEATGTLRMTSSALQEIVALLGCPAAGNPSQYLFERAIAAAELDWRFVTCDVAEPSAADAIAGIRALGLRGCLLSGPLRTAAVPHAGSLSPSAEFAGAVSLIERCPGGLSGHMTVGRGIVEAVRGHGDPAGRVAVVFGADARGRSAALELAVAGAAEIVVVDEDPAAADALVAALAAVQATAATRLDWSDTLTLPPHAGILVLGTGTPAVLEGLRPDLVVADVSLAGDLSPAAARAADRGCCLVDGLEIHAAQTAIDFQALTGVEPDTDMLREALEEFLS